MKRGRVVLERFESAVLRGNPAGDPAERTVPVYLPPSYDDSPATRYPVAFVLTGFTGRGRMLLNDNPWTPGSKDQNWERVITAISGNNITIDIPLTNSLDVQYGAGHSGPH